MWHTYAKVTGTHETFHIYARHICTTHLHDTHAKVVCTHKTYIKVTCTHVTHICKSNLHTWDVSHIRTSNLHMCSGNQSTCTDVPAPWFPEHMNAHVNGCWCALIPRAGHPCALIPTAHVGGRASMRSVSQLEWEHMNARPPYTFAYALTHVWTFLSSLWMSFTSSTSSWIQMSLIACALYVSAHLWTFLEITLYILHELNKFVDSDALDCLCTLCKRTYVDLSRNNTLHSPRTHLFCGFRSPRLHSLSNISAFFSKPHTTLITNARTQLFCGFRSPRLHSLSNISAFFSKPHSTLITNSRTHLFCEFRSPRLHSLSNISALFSKTHTTLITNPRTQQFCAFRDPRLHPPSNISAFFTKPHSTLITNSTILWIQKPSTAFTLKHQRIFFEYDVESEYNPWKKKCDVTQDM